MDTCRGPLAALRRLSSIISHHHRHPQPNDSGTHSPENANSNTPSLLLIRARARALPHRYPPTSADPTGAAHRNVPSSGSFVTSNCLACDRPQSYDSADLVRLSRSWIERHSDVITCAHLCQHASCSSLICGGCGKAGNFTQAHKIKIAGRTIQVSWCCDRGRLFCIWVLLGGAPPETTTDRLRTPVNKTRRSGIRRTLRQFRNRPVTGGGVPKGTGYGSSARPTFLGFYWKSPFKKSSSRLGSRSGVDAEKRCSMSRETYLRLITLFLTKPTAISDQVPPALLIALLTRSQCLSQAAALLNHDSLEFACKNNHIYDAMLDLLWALCLDQVTTALVLDGRSLSDEQPFSSKDEPSAMQNLEGHAATTERARSLAECLRSTGAQAQLVITHAQLHPTDFEDGVGETMLSLARKITRLCELCDKLKSQAQEQQTADPTGYVQEGTLQQQNSQPAPTPLISFSEWHRQAAVDGLEDEFFYDTYRYRFAPLGEQQLSSSSPPRGRMKRLITELSMLKTSLPEGIFVRYAASRLDMMKVLIIGSKDTPYEGGFFEFDVFCPMEYPQKPPKMGFVTTNGGTLRMNPNLYEDGHVCLSLLGTWAGEPWNPSQSTLIQVFVSIQAMVLCENPWYNEPGRERLAADPASDQYNCDVRYQTILFAVRPWVDLIEDKTQHGGDISRTGGADVGGSSAAAAVNDASDVAAHDKQDTPASEIGNNDNNTMITINTESTPYEQVLIEPPRSRAALGPAYDNIVLNSAHISYKPIQDLSRRCWLETAQVYFDERARDLVARSLNEAPRAVPGSIPATSMTTMTTNPGGGDNVSSSSSSSNSLTPLENAQELVRKLLAVKGYLS